MRMKIITLTSASALVLAAFAAAPAGAIQLAPGVGSAGSNIILAQRGEGGGGGNAAGNAGGSVGVGGKVGGNAGGSAGGSDGPSMSGRGQSGGDRGGQSVNRGDRPSVGERRRGDGPRVSGRDSSDARAQYERRGERAERRGDHRPVRRGWSRDRRHAFYGAFVIGVPFGYATYASHPCYSWIVGPRGTGYYWDYARCPV